MALVLYFSTNFTFIQLDKMDYLLETFYKIGDIDVTVGLGTSQF